MLKIRCSSLKELMTGRKLKNGNMDFGDTVKSMLKRQARNEIYGHPQPAQSQAIEKGLRLENDAIRAVGLLTGTMPVKNTERRQNRWITGECDVLTPNAIRDIKCSFSKDTHPWFAEDAQNKVKECGYDWQMQGYMWLWDLPVAYVDFILLPTPADILKPWDDEFYHIDEVQAIPLQERIITVKVEQDINAQAAIQARIAQAMPYYIDRYNELATKSHRILIGEGE